MVTQSGRCRCHVSPVPQGSPMPSALERGVIWLELRWCWLPRPLASAVAGRWWQREVGSAEWVPPPRKAHPAGNTGGLGASFPG